MNFKENEINAIRGLPEPLGAKTDGALINFAIFCPHATKLQLCLFKAPNGNIWQSIMLNPSRNRTGQVWHVAIPIQKHDFYYAYRIVESNVRSSNLLADHLLLDPYAQSVTAESPCLGELVKEPFPFDWEDDAPPNLAMHDLIIYEMHLKGFTADPSSGVEHPGTFKGGIEKIPHLVDLGINAVELLPLQRFSKTGLIDPITGEPRFNFWGYSTLNYFCLENAYSCQPDKGAAVITEFKQLVKELHKAKIELILDIVLNHTAEGNEQGTIDSFKGFAPDIYYLLTAQGEYYNYSGCGNTVNCNHPIVIEMIIKILRYWVVEMHVDGFRFDLAACFYRGAHGEILNTSPVLEAISKDPILAGTKLIAEPWDALGLYQVGHFYKQEPRWSEWNARYRDSVRRFIKGSGQKGDFATKLCGSQDLYYTQGPASSINFVTAHDGFTLADLVSYNHKHNEANGENNRDGNSFNDSWNCGVEGATSDLKINALRNRQMRNFHLALMVSQGVPMVLMGDEYGHTKNGNNNTWNQDNALNWFLWEELQKNSGFHRFYRGLIHFRKKHPSLRRNAFLTPADVEWHGQKLNEPAWQLHSNFIAFTLKENAKSIYIAFNCSEEELLVQLPLPASGKEWFWIVNTALSSPKDFCDPPDLVSLKTYSMPSYSALLLLEREK